MHEQLVHNNPARGFTKDEAEHVVRLINDESNIRMKSTHGNLFGTGTGYHGDRHLDLENISSGNNNDNTISNNTFISDHARLKKV